METRVRAMGCEHGQDHRSQCNSAGAQNSAFKEWSETERAEKFATLGA